MAVRHSPVERSRFYRNENERSNSPDIENSKDQIWENVKPKNNSKQTRQDHTRKDFEKTFEYMEVENIRLKRHRRNTESENSREVKKIK